MTISRNNTFFNKTVEYIKICVKQSSIHGLVHLVTKKSLMEKLLWMTLIALCTTGYIILAYKTWDRYQTNPTVITLELDYNNWNITFPSTTVCVEIKDESIDDYIETMHPNLNESERDEYKKFFRVLYTRSSFQEFHKIYDFDKLRKEDYLDTLLHITNDFTPVVSSTFGDPAELEKIITEMGICYAYNSEIAIYNSPKYWNDNRWDIIDHSGKIIKFNYKMTSQISTTLLQIYHEFQAYVHPNNEVIDFSAPYINVKEGIVRFILKISSIRATQGVIALKPTQRKCLFTHETNTLKHSPIYSYSTCRIDCRINLCLKFCNCLPYFYRRLEGEELCDTAGMRCLGKYAGNYLYSPQKQPEYLAYLNISFTDILENLRDKDTKKSLCDCLPNCNSDVAFIDFLEKTDWMFGNSFGWQVIYPKIRYRRQMLFGLENVLISIGGMAGLFLGCGVLSFIEIFYFMTLKLFWYIYNNYGKTTPKRKVRKLKQVNEYKFNLNY